MSTLATEIPDLRDLNARIAATDREIAAHEEQLEARKAELVEGGKTLATLTAEEAGELATSEREIKAKQSERLAFSDLAQSMVERHSASRPKEKTVARSFHELLLGGKTISAIMGGGLDTESVEVLTRDGLVARMESGRPWFQAAATADLDAGIPLDERLFPPVETLRRQVRLLDLITVGATDSDTVVYARQTTRTSAAAETDLGTAYSEASFDFEQATANVRSIGHFTTAYRENIADAAQFDTLVRRQLQEDVVLRLESQIAAGSGAGVNLEGILTNGTIQEVQHDATNDRRIVSLHRAITKVRDVFRQPDAIVMHPNDYQEMLFQEINLDSTTGAAIAFMPDLTGATPGRAWGLPIVVSPVITEGTALVAYWKDATLWVREGVSLRVSDSHSDYFVKRQVAVLADMRAAFSVQRPQAFVKVTTI